MKSLIMVKENEFYLDGELLPINEKTKNVYLELIMAKLESLKANYSKVICKTCSNGKKTVTTNLLVDEVLFEDLKKQVFLFTKIACMTDANNLNVVDFNSVNETLKYSSYLTKEHHEYHLIRRNRFDGYSIHLTFENFDVNELEKEYQSKVKKLVSSN